MVRPSFDIRPRSGHWVGDKWIEKPGRMADLYFFCWHGITDHKDVDQRDPKQWSFILVPSCELPPDQKTISLSVLVKSWQMVRADQLENAAAELVARLPFLPDQVTTQMENAAIPESHWQEIFGHEKGFTMSTYFEGLTLAKKKEIIEVIKYSGVNAVI